MLPKIKTNYQKVKVGTQDIEIRAWKTKEEKEYLIAKEQGDMSDESVFELLIKPCIKDGDKYSFTENEEIYIITKIREISLGSEITLTFTCSNPDCGKLQDQDISLNDIVKYKPESWHDVQIDDYTFVFKKNNSPKVKERLQKCKSKVEKDYTSMILSITEIKEGKKTYDAFTFDELYEFIENLDTKTFDALIEAYFGMVDEVTMNWEAKCLFCGETTKGNLESIPNFLWD